MRLMIMLLLLIAPPVIYFATGPHCEIGVSRIDIEGYPVYTVWRNGLHFGSFSSRSMAESCSREYCEKARK